MTTVKNWFDGGTEEIEFSWEWLQEKMKTHQVMLVCELDSNYPILIWVVGKNERGGKTAIPFRQWG